MTKRSIVWGVVSAVVVILAGFGVLGYFTTRQNSLVATSSYGEAGVASGSMGSPFGLAAKIAASAPATEMAADRDIAPGPPVGGGGVAPAVKERLIIKTGTVGLVVRDVSVALKAIMDYAVGNNGFVVSSNQDKSGLAPTADVTVRIPVKIFDQSLAAFRALGDVQNQQVTGQDVTDEYVDLDSRLRNLQATETQFLDIMKKAQKIDDILAVQRELSNVRSQIEVMQGRMKYLRESAAFSTVTVNLATDQAALPVMEKTDQWKPVAVVKDAVRSLLEVGKGLVNLFIWFVIYSPLWFGIWFVVRLIRHWRKRRKAEKPTNNT
ncbi:MAG: DUF4349 domain-containing protein [Candidatus Magasanikbacteria bacterium]|nr:DUF4349 domain-containing protein [Candidatus Magasanikbacteria bacterium]